jgi:preprotein translocase subunit SecG
MGVSPYRQLVGETGNNIQAINMTSSTYVNEKTFMDKMYPVNGQKEVSYTETTTTKHKQTSMIVATAVFSILFLVFAVLMFILYKKEHANDQADEHIRQSVTELDADVYDSAGQRLVE